MTACSRVRAVLALVGPVLLGGLFLAAAPSNAATVVSQGECPGAFGECIAFDYNTAVIPIVREFSFKVPANSRVLVTFHGSMTCAAFPNSGNVRIAVISQIVPNAADVPNVSGRSGAKHIVILRIPTETGVGDARDTFNLTSTRYMSFAKAGKKTVYFKLLKESISAGGYCSVLNATFSAVITP